MSRRRFGLFLLITLIMLGLFLGWRYFAGPAENKPKVLPVPVLVSKVTTKDVPLYLDTIGTVTPIDSINVKTQINGRIMSVHFKEGQMVKKGDLLVQIDERPYVAALEEAEGQLIHDEAQLENARLDLKRYESLDKQDSISKQAYDTQKAVVKQLEGTVKTDRGVLEAARLNVQYCQITSSIDGVAGLRQINPGNYILITDTTPITTVNTISPISVVFSLAEFDLPRVQDSVKNGPLTTEAYDRKQEALLETGTLSALDSQIDNSTGTIKLKAVFENKSQKLYPNQFVNIKLKIGTLTNSLVVPTAAIQIGREGPLVYVMDEATKKVSPKLVKVATAVGLESAVTGDIQSGQTIVTQGQEKLKEGTEVTPSTVDSQVPAASGQGPGR